MRIASRDRTLPCYARICLWALPKCTVHVRVSKRHACRLTALCSLLHRLAGCERSSGERVPRSSASIVHASDYMYIGPAEMRKSRDSDVKVSWCGDRGCIVGIHRCNSHAKRAYKCHRHDPSAEPIHTSGPRSSRRPPTTHHRPGSRSGYYVRGSRPMAKVLLHGIVRRITHTDPPPLGSSPYAPPDDQGRARSRSHLHTLLVEA